MKTYTKREDNNKMDLGETGWGYIDWIHLAQGSDKWRVLEKSVMNLQFQ